LLLFVVQTSSCEPDNNSAVCSKGTVGKCEASIFDSNWTIPIKFDKKDGYRQQNVRQRQKLISIIDYDVCMTFY